MDNMDLKLCNNITFKTLGYRKNFDFVNDDENIITEYDGNVSEIRMSQAKPPVIIGEYGFSVWNINVGKKLNVDFNKLIKVHHIENTYDELMRVINQGDLDIQSLNKLVLIHTLILQKDYRKRGITEEFIEMIYRDFYCENIAVIALIKPFQNNPIDADFYFKRKSVQVKETLNSKNYLSVPAIDYYSLNELIEKTDTEINEYKLFNVASKCGFNRIGNSYLFKFSPENIINRISEKRKHIKLNI